MKSRFHAMLRDRRGNIAMMFGLMLFAIMGGAGVAVDLTRTNLVRTEINEATDAAILAAARYRASHPNASDAELSAVAQRVFDNEIPDQSSVDIKSFKVVFDDDTDTFVADVDGTMDTLIMGVLGDKYVDIDAHSEVRLGKPPLLEVALALDTTGSMKDNNRLVTLKKAANDLVDSLFEAEDADVKIGVVPFAQYVNVGVKHKAANWISGAGPGWAGCIGSRIHPYNTRDSDYTMVNAPAATNSVNDPGKAPGSPVECPADLLPLTEDDTKVNAVISGLFPKGNTFIPSGLTWGWALLSPAPPFSEGLSYDTIKTKNGVKTLILMTDGENTRAPTYPLHESPDNLLADKLTGELCDNVKKDEIVLYTIAFEIKDPVIKDILEKCATSPDHFFDASNSSDLIDAFATIAMSLRNISLSK